MREAHDQLRNSRRNLVWFIFKSNRSWKKVCKFIERFFEKVLKMILKSEGYSQEVLKKIRFENWKENIFEKY